jgi:hypothetical protein
MLFATQKFCEAYLQLAFIGLNIYTSSDAVTSFISRKKKRDKYNASITKTWIYKKSTPESPANAESNETDPAKLDTAADFTGAVEFLHASVPDMLRLLTRVRSAHYGWEYELCESMYFFFFSDYDDLPDIGIRRHRWRRSMVGSVHQKQKKKNSRMYRERRTWMVIFCPSWSVLLDVWERSRGRQKPPSPVTFRSLLKGVNSVKLSKEVGFWAVETKTPAKKKGGETVIFFFKESGKEYQSR